jgi:anti-anti-sigma factor
VVIRNESEGVIVLAPTQDLHEGRECDQMEDALVRLAERGAKVVIDVSHVSHISAHCLGILAHAHLVASQHGGRIALCGATHIQRWLLRKTGLADVVSIHKDVAAARRHLTTLPRVVARGAPGGARVPAATSATLPR